MMNYPAAIVDQFEKRLREAQILAGRKIAELQETARREAWLRRGPGYWANPCAQSKLSASAFLEHLSSNPPDNWSPCMQDVAHDPALDLAPDADLARAREVALYAKSLLLMQERRLVVAREGLQKLGTPQALALLDAVDAIAFEEVLS